jgi:polysaccharide pyruvyl transferase WcaK-like protein
MRAGALVRWSDLLVLRDPGAAEALAAAGAPGPFRVGADPAWCAIGTEPPASNRRDEVLVVLDSRVAHDSGHLAAALDLVAAQGLRIRLVPWRTRRHGADDLDLARVIAAQLGARARVLLPPSNLEEARAEAARSRVVVALRLHAMIVAASAGVPFLAVNGEREMAHQAWRLEQPAIPLLADPGAIARAVLDAADGAPAPLGVVEAERNAAAESFRLLRLLLDAEESEEDIEVEPLPLAPLGPPEGIA